MGANDEAGGSRDALAGALNRTVVALGLVSLFTDAASDMVWPLLPLFIVEGLHRSVRWVGVIEGVAEATAAAGKYLAGLYSDRVARRKPLVVAGYGISSLVRPLLALAASPFLALVVRFFDRVGKGIRSAPRDALLAASTPPERRSAAFGFHRAMDNAGAVIGPLLALAVLAVAPGNLRAVFALSAVPGLLAVVALIALVPEAPRVATPPRAPDARRPAARPPLRRGFGRYLAVVGLFSLANASDFFLLAKARAVGTPVWALPLVWAGLSLLRALAATPGGALADRIGKRRALAVGWALYAAVYVGLAFARTPLPVVACVVVYGGYYGLTEGAEKALVASFAEPGALGRAYGLFALVTGLAAVPASAVFGALYPIGAGRASFLVAGGLAALAAVATLSLRGALPERDPR